MTYRGGRTASGVSDTLIVGLRISATRALEASLGQVQ